MGRRIGLLVIMASLHFLMLGATTGTSQPTGEVENILAIKVIPFDSLSTVLPELRSYDTPPEGTTIATVEISNNDPEGFSVSLHSEKRGRLMRHVDGIYPVSPKRGDFIEYLLEIRRGDSGVLGGDMPPVSERTNLNLDSDQTIVFDSGGGESTIKAVLEVQIHTKAKANLFHGQFADVITFIASDI